MAKLKAKEKATPTLDYKQLALVLDALKPPVERGARCPAASGLPSGEEESEEEVAGTRT